MKRSLLGRGRIAGSILLTAAILCAGCTARVRHYDDYDHDYHPLERRRTRVLP